MARFSEVLTIINGKNQSKVENPNGRYPIYGSGGIMGYADSYLCKANTVIIGRKGSINKPIFVETPFWNVDTAFGLEADVNQLLPKYLFYFCEKFDFEKLNTTVTIPSLTKANLLKIDIPLPSLNEQRGVVDRLDKVNALISLRKKQLQKLDDLVKSRFVEMFGDPEFNTKSWPIQSLDKLCKVSSSKRIYQNEQSNNGVPFWRVSDLVSKMDTGIANSGLFIPEEKYIELKSIGLVPTSGDILVTSRGTLGRCYIIKDEDKFYFQDGMISWLSGYADSITPVFLQYLFAMPGFRKQIDNMQAGSTVAYLSIAMLKKLRIMIPNKDAQKNYAAFVDQVNESKLTVQQGLDKLELLKQSLMQKYFG